jgi:hypothetical protein
VEENLEGSTSERLQGVNTKTHFPIKNSEFEKAVVQVQPLRRGLPNRQGLIAE